VFGSSIIVAMRCVAYLCRPRRAASTSTPHTLLLLAGLSLLGACKDDDRPSVPAAPNQEPTTPIGVGHPPDGGDEEDAGEPRDAAPDSGPVLPAFTCERVEVLGSSGEDTPNLTSTDNPHDFKVSRQAVSWLCDPKRLVIALSDGNCPKGAGHELTLELSVAAVQDGAIRLGMNRLQAEADRPDIRVRYTRPKRLKPNGVWGNCKEPMDESLLTFLEAPDVALRSILQARYSFTLPACDDTSNAPILVSGAFKLTLRLDPAEACPAPTP
jgi:hypothetical protein